MIWMITDIGIDVNFRHSRHKLRHQDQMGSSIRKRWEAPQVSNSKAFASRRDGHRGPRCIVWKCRRADRDPISMTCRRCKAMLAICTATLA